MFYVQFTALATFHNTGVSYKNLRKKREKVIFNRVAEKHSVSAPCKKKYLELCNVDVIVKKHSSITVNIAKQREYTK